MLIGLSFGTVMSRRPPFAQSSGPAPGASYWWDPSQGISQSGGFVSAWTDRVGGQTAMSLLAGNQPSYTANINGMPTLTFDGVDDVLAAPQVVSQIASGTTPPAFSLFAVIRPTIVSNNASGYDYCGFSAAMGSGALYIGHNNGNAIVWKRNNAGSIGFYGSGSGVTLNKSVVISIVYNGSTFTVYVDGVFKYTSAANSTAATFDTFSIGALWNPMAGFLSQFKGDMADLMLYPSALSDASRQQTEAYFRTKYGTA